MTDRVYNVLFLCTGNTARSVLEEGILRKDGAGRFTRLDKLALKNRLQEIGESEGATHGHKTEA